MKKIGILLTVAVIATILFLTLQSSEDTLHLSETVRTFLHDRGIDMSSTQLRSDVHVFEYLPLGFVLCLWLGWKKGILIGSLLGLADETLKIFLPTREFSAVDFGKDVIGVTAGAALCLILKMIVTMIKDQRTNS
ncbi:MAG: VanZ family protein [Anaerolineaceae bacterium]|nr:VanZ family protein [Anaerolineaceae bacterium]